MKATFARNFDELERIVALTDAFFKNENIDPAARYVVDLCVEELFVNMVKYDTESDQDILIEMTPHERGVKVRMTEFDVDRFDPREAPAVDVNAPLEARSPGGLGVFLVLKMVESIHYEYRDRTSRITFVAGVQ